jgi:hypothetical protein
MDLRIEVTGATETERSLYEISRSLEPAEMMKTFEIIIVAMEKYYKDTWGHGVETTPDTRVRWPMSTTLDNTGDLKASLTEHHAKGAIRIITPFGFEFGTDLFYARLVNDGTTRQSPKAFFKLGKPMEDLMLNIISSRVIRPTL